MKTTVDDVDKKWKQNIQAVWENFGRDGVHTRWCWFTVGDNFRKLVLGWLGSKHQLTNFTYGWKLWVSPTEYGGWYSEEISSASDPVRVVWIFSPKKVQSALAVHWRMGGAESLPKKTVYYWKHLPWICASSIKHKLNVINFCTSNCALPGHSFSNVFQHDVGLSWHHGW